LLTRRTGYVFGLWHEHQRYDRDQYIRFNCEALKGYEGAKMRVQSQGRHSMDEVCTHGVIAASYGFYAVESYTKHDTLDPGATKIGLNYPRYQNYPENDYDYMSIMQYSSNPKNWFDDNKKLQSSLAFWKHGGPNFVPPTTVTKDDLDFIYDKSRPSDKDVKAIQMLYPYVQQVFKDGQRVDIIEVG
jgi:hypothetical protein